MIRLFILGLTLTLRVNVMAIAVFQMIMENSYKREKVGILRVYETDTPRFLAYPQPYKFFTVMQIQYDHAFLHGGKDLSITKFDMSAMRLEAGRLQCSSLSWTHNGKFRTVSTIKPFPFEPSSFDVSEVIPDGFIYTPRPKLTYSQMVDMSHASS
jgi:hypothetical protein